MHDEASVVSKTESIFDSEVSHPASSQLSDGEDKDEEAQTLAPDFLNDLNEADAAVLPASKPLPTTIDPHEVWRQLPLACVADRWGYGRSPAFGIH